MPKTSAESPAALIANNESIVLFTVGSIDWLTFKPIIEGLARRSVPFRYMTMDKNDPGLDMTVNCMTARYIGSGLLGYLRAALFKAPLMLATVPHIGAKGYPLPRPKGVGCLAHVFHSVSDIATYRKGSLDHYDAVLLGGEYMLEGVRAVERLRGLPSKECFPYGLPYLDELFATARLSQPQSPKLRPTLLVAPSWGKKNFLAAYGCSCLRELAKRDYDLIIRPHPHSRKHEKDFLERLEQSLQGFPNISFDYTVDGSGSLAAADVLISDYSGIRFDFALIYGRSVITVEVPAENMDSYEYGDIGFRGEEALERQMGPVLAAGDCSEASLGAMLLVALEAARRQAGAGPEYLRQYVANFGASGDAIAEWAVNKCREALAPKKG